MLGRRTCYIEKESNRINQKSSGQLIRAFSLCQKFKYKFVDDLWFLMIDPMRSIIDKDQLAIWTDLDRFLRQLSA